MTQEQYIKKLLKIKKELNTLTDELWKSKYIKQCFYNKDWLLESVVDDMFYAEKGENLKVPIENIII